MTTPSSRTDDEARALLDAELEALAPRADALGADGLPAVAGWRLFNAYEFEAAALAYESAADADPQGIEVRFQHGMCLLELGRYDDAAADFRAAIELSDALRDDPDEEMLDWVDDDPAYRLGNALHAKGDLDAAVDAYEVSATRNTVGTDALREIARCRLAARRPAEALAVLDRMEARTKRLSVHAEIRALRADAERTLAASGDA